MIVVLTALELECAAVREHLSDLRPHQHPAGTMFEVGQLRIRPTCTVALAVIGIGTVNAAAMTEQAIAEFSPTAVVVVGIAGGLREWIHLGDIVVATRVHAYQGGRVDEEEFKARPRSWDTSHRLAQLAKYVNRTGAWPGAAQSTATVHFEPVAAGDVVLNSTSSYLNELLSTHYNDAVAIEMESVGVALAGHLHESTPTIAIRGISDRADGAKQHADNEGWQPIAARNAAAFAAGLVASIDENSTSVRAESQEPGQSDDEQQQIRPAVNRSPIVTVGGNSKHLTVAGRDISKTNKFRFGTGGWIAAAAAVIALSAGTVGIVTAIESDPTNPTLPISTTPTLPKEAQDAILDAIQDICEGRCAIEEIVSAEKATNLRMPIDAEQYDEVWCVVPMISSGDAKVAGSFLIGRQGRLWEADDADEKKFLRAGCANFPKG